MTSWPRVLVMTVREHFAGQSDIFAAGMAFFTAVSLAPLLVIAVAIAGTVYGPEAARAQLLHDVTSAMGPTAATTIDSFVGRAALEHNHSWRLVFGIVVATWGAARIFSKMQETLNALWGVRPRKDLPWRDRLRVLVRKRLYAFLLVGLVGALLFASMLLQSVASGLAALTTELPFGSWPWRAMQGVTAIAIVTAVLIPIYRVLPDVELDWREVLPGALVAAVVATLGASAVGFYLGYAATSSLTGAAGGVLLLLLWMYFDGHVLLFGARLTRAWVARRRGAIVPEQHAELVR
jgi:membrane protein